MKAFSFQGKYVGLVWILLQGATTCAGPLAAGAQGGGRGLPSSASVASGKGSSQEDPLKIVADRVEYDQEKSQCVAEGKVYIEKKREEGVDILSADRVIVFFEPSTLPLSTPDQKTQPSQPGSSSGPSLLSEGSKKQPSRFEAQGNVVMKMKESHISGDHGTYNPLSHIVEIFGQVQLISSKGQMRGAYGWANLKTGQYRVTQSPPSPSSKRDQEGYQGKDQKKGDKKNPSSRVVLFIPDVSSPQKKAESSTVGKGAFPASASTSAPPRQ